MQAFQLLGGLVSSTAVQSLPEMTSIENSSADHPPERLPQQLSILIELSSAPAALIQPFTPWRPLA